jgi:hypothetical protein
MLGNVNKVPKRYILKRLHFKLIGRFLRYNIIQKSPTFNAAQFNSAVIQVSSSNTCVCPAAKPTAAYTHSRQSIILVITEAWRRFGSIFTAPPFIIKYAPCVRRKNTVGAAIKRLWSERSVLDPKHLSILKFGNGTCRNSLWCHHPGEFCCCCSFCRAAF